LASCQQFALPYVSRALKKIMV